MLHLDGANYQIWTPWRYIKAPQQSGDLSGQRAIGQWYQNALGMPMQVSLTVRTTGGSVGQIVIYCGPVSGTSPAVLIDENTASVNGAEVGYTFMVPHGWFYAIVTSGNITGVGRWYEWTCP